MRDNTGSVAVVILVIFLYISLIVNICRESRIESAHVKEVTELQSDLKERQQHADIKFAACMKQLTKAK